MIQNSIYCEKSFPYYTDKNIQSKLKMCPSSYLELFLKLFTILQFGLQFSSYTFELGFTLYVLCTPPSKLEFQMLLIVQIVHQ